MATRPKIGKPRLVEENVPGTGVAFLAPAKGVKNLTVDERVAMARRINENAGKVPRYVPREIQRGISKEERRRMELIGEGALEVIRRHEQEQTAPKKMTEPEHVEHAKKDHVAIQGRERPHKQGTKRARATAYIAAQRKAKPEQDEEILAKNLAAEVEVPFGTALRWIKFGVK